MDTMFMSIVLDPVIALIGILVPLGVAYVILFMEARKPDSTDRKNPATARNEMLQKRT